jgi:hypothetical protein
MKFPQQKLNIPSDMYKFIDKDGNWTERIQRVEEDIPKVAVRYSVQENETKRGKLRV